FLGGQVERRNHHLRGYPVPASPVGPVLPYRLHRIDEHAVEIEDDRAHPIAFGHERSLRKLSGLERRPSDRREVCLTPRRGREQAPIVPCRCDQLQSERQAVRAETAREYDRRRSLQRPARADARVAGCFRGRGFVYRGWSEER